MKLSSGLMSIVLSVTVVAPAVAIVQHTHSPGQTAGTISTLTEEQVTQLRAGEGMGFAKAAELNHYPGPRHVLDLAKELGLTAGQAERIRAIQTRMHEEAVRLGEQVIAAEASLDQHFKHRHVSDESIRTMTLELGRLQGELRAVHLRAHLQTAEVLANDQVARYDELRGYR
jgi:hypothetical protein